jgi:hypothetical protein
MLLAMDELWQVKMVRMAATTVTIEIVGTRYKFQITGCVLSTVGTVATTIAILTNLISALTNTLVDSWSIPATITK